MTKTLAIARSRSDILGLGAALFMGLGLVFAAGMSASAHDLAHDSRHAIGFPCH